MITESQSLRLKRALRKEIVKEAKMENKGEEFKGELRDFLQCRFFYETLSREDGFLAINDKEEMIFLS